MDHYLFGPNHGVAIEAVAAAAELSIEQV